MNSMKDIMGDLIMKAMFKVECGLVEFINHSDDCRQALSAYVNQVPEVFSNSTTPHSTLNIAIMMRSLMMSFMEFMAKMEINDTNFSPN